MSDVKKAIIVQAVRAIEYDIMDRNGLADEWDRIDEAMQVEIRNKWYRIIEQAIDRFPYRSDER
jgi:hypothetical protein